MAVPAGRIKELAGSAGGRIFAGAIAIGTVAATFPVADGAVFDPEKAIGIIAVIGAWLATEWASWNPGPHPHDIDLRNRIRTRILGVMAFLRSHDFGQSFPFGLLNPLDDIIRNFVGSSYEFVDPDLQVKWAVLVSETAEFLNYIALNTFREDDALHHSSFLLDRDRGGMISNETQSKIDHANAMATKLYQGFDDFERLCIQRLGAFEEIDS